MADEETVDPYEGIDLRPYGGVKKIGHDPVAREIVVRGLIHRKMHSQINAELVAAGKEPVTTGNISGVWAKKEEVIEGRKAIDEAIQQLAWGDRIAQLAALQEVKENIERIFQERGEELQGFAAGGGTGYMTEDVKSIGAGEFAETVKIYRADTELLKQYRETMKQMSAVRGELVTKTDVSGKVEVTEVPLTPAQRAARVAALFAEGEAANVDAGED